MKTQTPKLFITVFAAFTLFICSNVNAQSTEKSNLRFGIGVDGLLPLGNLSNTENFALGITPRLQYRLSSTVSLTLTSGLYHFFPKSIALVDVNNNPVGTYKFKSDIIPVKAGAKFFLSPNIYFGAEAGAGFQVAEGGGPVALILAPGIGYANKKWDINARYEDFTYNGYSNGVIGLRIAYGFGL